MHIKLLSTHTRTPMLVDVDTDIHMNMPSENSENCDQKCITVGPRIFLPVRRVSI